jgi:hypothetical protein
MSNSNESIKIDGAKLETPLTIRQVESHLMFGPLSRHFPCAFLALAGGILSLIAGFYATHSPLVQYLGSIIDKLVFFAVPWLMFRMTYRQQAIVGWLAVKLAFGVTAIILAASGAAASFRGGQADAWPKLLLGLIWIPGIEFIPKIAPHQRYVTLARMALSIPCIYFGINGGGWHW